MEKFQTYIGILAVAKKFLSQQQLDECIAWLDNEDSQTKIGDALLQKGYLSPEQLKQLEGKRSLNIQKIQDQAIIDYLSKMKMVASDKLARSLEVQKKAKEEKKKYIPLEALLLSHGVIDEEKLKKVTSSKAIKRKVRQTIWSHDPRRMGLIGRVIGGYEISSKVAAGGMGVVYKALQLELQRTVALKILFEKFAVQKKHLNQFFREAKLSAILNHPNLVHLFDMGHDQGFFYYSMELVEGENLGDYLHEKGKLPQEESLDIITQAGRGLEHIHGFQIVHRDIKPSNFLIRTDGIVKIMDLGLARQLFKVQKKASTMGTPFYMAPELIHNPKEADHRADIYALGVSFYRLLSGEYPITGTDARQILKNIAEQVHIPVVEHVPEVSPEISKVIDKMIAKDTSERYQNMTDVLNDLDRILIY